MNVVLRNRRLHFLPVTYTSEYDVTPQPANQITDLLQWHLPSILTDEVPLTTE